MTAPVDPRGRPRRAPRGRCSGCGRDYALTTAGNVRFHDVAREDGPFLDICTGARKPPADRKETRS